MNAGATAERVYDAVKRRIMDHAFKPGDRLDPSVLSDALASSVTPVRDALHMLTGEGLVETRTSDGFHVPQIDEPALKDIYAWNREVIILAIRAWPHAGRGPAPIANEYAPVTQADAARDLFAKVAERSFNAEHRRAIASLNTRLHASRVVEAHALDGIDAELNAISEAFSADDRDALRRLTTLYHRRRNRAAAEIVRALYRIG